MAKTITISFPGWKAEPNIPEIALECHQLSLTHYRDTGETILEIRGRWPTGDDSMIIDGNVGMEG